MPRESPATSPIFGAPRYADNDDATFSSQVNSVTDTFDAKATLNTDPRLSDARNPLPGSVTAATIPNASITGAKLAAQTVTETNLAPGSVGSPEIIDGSIANVDLGTGVVDARVIGVGAIQTQNVGDGQVTAPKLGPVAQLALNAPGDLILSAASARAGAVLCDGSAYSRTSSTYAALFAAIGTAYGGGDGSTTFNVPDYRGRALVTAGQGAGLTVRAVGALFGEESHALSVYEMPSHAHGVNAAATGIGIYAAATGIGLNDGGHSHSVANLSNNQSAQLDIWKSGDGHGAFTSPGTGTQGTSWQAANIGVSDPTHAHSVADPTHAHTIAANGNSGAHNNCQPSAAVNVFIKL